jgi:hypothetical protein
MKPMFIFSLKIAMAVLMVAACGPNQETLRATVEAEVAQEMAQNATQTSMVVELAALEAEKTALAQQKTQAVAPPPVPGATSAMQTPAVSAPPQPSLAGSCPFYVYKEWGDAANHFVPEGWMGDVADIRIDDNYKLDPERPAVIQIVYTPAGPQQWSGIYWWDPPGSNFGTQDGGYDISCATKLTFWARGEKGGEKAELKVGGLRGAYLDSINPAFSTGPITLTNTWVQYTLVLEGKDLTHILGGFVWVTNKPSNRQGATIYLDDIRYEQ